MEKLRVAMYCRVANKETTKEDSAIEVQKKMLNDYLKNNVKGIKFREFYIDNGFSGTNYNRPEFKRMIKDIEENRINTIIVKDLVRFGRTNNTLQRIDGLKKKYNINFISVVDNIDSLKNQDEFEKSILISNLMNVWYKNDLKKRREVQRKLKGR